MAVPVNRESAAEAVVLLLLSLLAFLFLWRLHHPLFVFVILPLLLVEVWRLAYPIENVCVSTTLQYLHYTCSTCR